MNSADWKQSKISKIIPTDESWLQDVLLNCELSTEFFCRYFLSASFETQPVFEQRRQHFAKMDDDTIPKLAVCAYRGFMKTTALWGFLVRAACHRTFNFALVTSQTEDHATSISEDVKSELLGNYELRECYGITKPKSFNGVNPVFSKTSWVLADSDGNPYWCMVPKGMRQQVNGLVMRLNVAGRSSGAMCRPDLIADDDIEDRDKIMNEDLRAKWKDWYEGALLPCVPRIFPDPKTNKWIRDKSDPGWRPPWRILKQDTLKHEDSIMADVMQSQDWDVNVFPLCEETEPGSFEFRSLVPELYSDEVVQAQAKKFDSVGRLDRFAMEYMCKPQASSKDSWSKALFQYYFDRQKTEDFNDDDRFDKAVIVDPAKTATARSAFTGILGWAADIRTKDIFFRDLINARLQPYDQARRAIEMCVALNTPSLAVEITGLEEHVKQLFINAVVDAGLENWIELVWLDARNAPKFSDYGTGKDAAKRARASQLLPYYQEGRVWHEWTLKNSALERQELSFPKCARWDALDCGGYVPQLLYMSGRYAQPTIVEEKKMAPPKSSREEETSWDRAMRDREYAISYE